MDEERLNLGVLKELAAETFGEPGKRTFRLKATTGSGEVHLWLEKEQLVALGAAVEQILERVPQEQGVEPRTVTSAAEITGEVTARAGSLSLAFDTTQNVFAIEASDLIEATLDVQIFLLLVTRAQLQSVEAELDAIIAAGRPRCPMCGTPLTAAAHFCPPSNGHAKVRD